MDRPIDIADVARQTGLTARALRFYEARGLVMPLRTGAGRRLYGPGEIARLNAVVALKRAGFPLARIKTMLGDRTVDLAQLIAAQLQEIDARAAELSEARALLLAVRVRVDRGEPIDIATLCALIRQGETTMEADNWQKVTDRYFSPEQQAEWAATMATIGEGFDQQAYQDRWRELSGRIEAAMPMDPRSDAAQRFVDEWFTLLKPFSDVATPAMWNGTVRMYDDMAAWEGQADPGFSKQVWDFIRQASAARLTAGDPR